MGSVTDAAKTAAKDHAMQAWGDLVTGFKGEYEKFKQMRTDSNGVRPNGQQILRLGVIAAASVGTYFALPKMIALPAMAAFNGVTIAAFNAADKEIDGETQPHAPTLSGLLYGVSSKITGTDFLGMKVEEEKKGKVDKAKDAALDAAATVGIGKTSTEKKLDEVGEQAKAHFAKLQKSFEITDWILIGVAGLVLRSSVDMTVLGCFFANSAGYLAGKQLVKTWVNPKIRKVQTNEETGEVQEVKKPTDEMMKYAMHAASYAPAILLMTGLIANAYANGMATLKCLSGLGLGSILHGYLTLRAIGDVKRDLGNVRIGFGYEYKPVTEYNGFVGKPKYTEPKQS